MTPKNYSWMILNAITRHREAEAKFMTQSRPAQFSDFTQLANAGNDFDLQTTLADLGRQGVLSYRTDDDGLAQDITLSRYGEGVLKQFESASYDQSHAPAL